MTKNSEVGCSLEVCFSGHERADVREPTPWEREIYQRLNGHSIDVSLFLAQSLSPDIIITQGNPPPSAARRVLFFCGWSVSVLAEVCGLTVFDVEEEVRDCLAG